MIADAGQMSEQVLDYEVSARSEPPKTRLAVTMARQRNMPGRQRQAQRARFRRGSASAFNGSHRRRDKRSYL